MALISISNLTFAYEGSYDNIFTDVSFQLDTEWKLGFVGRNGRGKTTFLNLLLGKFEYQGIIAKNTNFAYFPFNIEDKMQNTIEVIYKINKDFTEWELIRELKRLEVLEEVLYRPFNTLSHGEQSKIFLGTLFLKEDNFLLIDEPTNHLDTNGRIIVSKYLKTKKGFILVSHDRLFLDNCIDHILSINKTNIEIQKGNFSSWYYNKQLIDNVELAENEKLKKEIKRLNTATKRTKNWSDRIESRKHGGLGENLDRGYIGHKSAKMMKRAKTLELRQKSTINEKSCLLKNIEKAESLKIGAVNYHTQSLIELKNVTIFYRKKAICDGININIKQGDRIALQGKNGCGKSSVLKLIVNGNIDYSGEFKIGSQLVCSYVSQDTSFLKGNLTDYATECKIEESLFKSILRKFDFSRIQFGKNMEDFSGGQKKKVLLAKSLCERAHIYIWDEPLNYIDIFSRMQIEEMLLAYQPTILFVEHDQAFTNKIATNIVYM